MRVRQFVLMAGMLVPAWLAGDGGAAAHDVVRQSSPAAGATMAAGALPIEITFSGRIDRARSNLRLGSAGSADRLVALDQSAPANILRSAAPVSLEAGAYTLHWLVLSSDGHLTRGDIPFQVAAPK